jgi:DNA-binding MarR family transcriptional regulator
MTTTSDTDIQVAAARIATVIEGVRRVLRESVWVRARDYPMALTAPQIHALQVVVEHTRQKGVGISLSALAKQMGLAHSTVSGIISRLERDGVLRRTARPDDRRYTAIELTHGAEQWVRQEIPAARLGPLESAIRQASSDELAAVLDGLAILERLLPGTAQHSLSSG